MSAAMAMTLLEAPARTVVPDLEAVAALELDPDYVLVFIPPWLCERIRDRLTRPGWWELLTVGDYEAGDHASDDWALEAPRHAPAGRLAAWVARLLGYPVALEADTAEMKVPGRLTRWHSEPLYWVRRDT